MRLLNWWGSVIKLVHGIKCTMVYCTALYCTALMLDIAVVGNVIYRGFVMGIGVGGGRWEGKPWSWEY